MRSITSFFNNVFTIIFNHYKQLIILTMITLSSAHCISIGVHFFGCFIVSIFDKCLIFDVVDIFDVSTWPQNKCCHFFFFLLQLQEIHTDVGWMVCSTKLRFGENKNKWRKSSISSKKFFTRQKRSPIRVVHFTGMKMVPRKNIIYFDI